MLSLINVLENLPVLAKRKKKRILHYISGPITGVENYEEKFSRVEYALKAAGLDVVNPVNISRNMEICKKALPDSLPYSEYMKADIQALLLCDAIIMLPGYEKSRGAMLELQIAQALGYELFCLVNNQVYKFTDLEILLPQEKDGATIRLEKELK